VARGSKILKKKMASLSALGAGALVFGAGRAEAAIIYSGSLDAHVGFTSGNPNYVSPGLGPLSATFSFATLAGTYGKSHHRAIAAYGCGCLVLAALGGQLDIFNAGAVWTAGLSAGTAMLVGGRVWGTGYYTPASATVPTPYTFFTAFGEGPFDHQYSLFAFTPDGINTLYGWIQLSYSVSGQFGPDAIFGPELTIHDWAYDDTGAPIAAGQTVDLAQVPEPATAVSTGLAALVLGAVGLRQWRKTRQPV
jgi:hypothetical protein